jgi:hypothetical protein
MITPCRRAPYVPWRTPDGLDAHPTLPYGRLTSVVDGGMLGSQTTNVVP